MRDGVKRGEIGPVAGFHMEYVIEARRLSAMEELRAGTSASITIFRLVETSWPSPIWKPKAATRRCGNNAETSSAGLRDADADTTITFWVYPDSYALYRQLQEFAHHENFTVAARPIPFGVPIAGSPQGSRSAGQ